MKKNVVITIDIEIDMEGAKEWKHENQYIENEVQEVLSQMSGMGVCGWYEWQTELPPTKLDEFTTFQYDTEIK